MIEKLKEVLGRIEMTPVQWVVGAICIITGRIFLEIFSNPPESGYIYSSAPSLAHFYLFFVSIGLVLMIVLRYAIPTWKKEIPGLVLFGLLITYLAPIVDWLRAPGMGASMAYSFHPLSVIWMSAATFFGPDLGSAVTAGMRLEILLLLFGIGILVFEIERNVLRAAVSVAATYIVILVAGYLPGLLTSTAHIFGGTISDPTEFIAFTISRSSTLADNIHGMLRYASVTEMLEVGFSYLMGRVWFLITGVLAWVWLLSNFRQKAIALWRNSRWERALLFGGLMLLGMLVAYKEIPFNMNMTDWLLLATLFVSICFSWMSAVCLNDLQDIEIDRISNPERALLNKELSSVDMKNAGLILLMLALVGGFLCGYYAAICIIVCNALAYAYSVPPTRLKKIPFLSALIMSFCCLDMVMAGFFTFSLDKQISAFPVYLVAEVTGFFLLWQHIKDLKDADGDRAGGILTIPTMLGSVWGPRVVGALAALAYLIVPLFASRPSLFLGAIPAAAITYWLAIKKPYVEWPIFAVYYAFMVFLGLMFFVV